MASLKPTMSSDGLKRATVQVSHRIDIEYLLVMAVNIISRRGTRRVRKKKLEEELRFELLREGQNGVKKIHGCNQWDSESWKA